MNCQRDIVLAVEYDIVATCVNLFIEDFDLESTVVGFAQTKIKVHVAISDRDGPGSNIMKPGRLGPKTEIKLKLQVDV